MHEPSLRSFAGLRERLWPQILAAFFFSGIAMYSDPTLIREHVVKIRLNDNEADLINAWVRYTGQQKAVLLRDMLLEQATLDMAANFAALPMVQEVPQLALFKIA